MNFPQDNPWHAGFDPSAYLNDADLVIVLESEVPWIPSRTKPREDAFVIHMAEDPLFHRYPMRAFPSGLNVGGDVAGGLRKIAVQLERLGADMRSPPARNGPSMVPRQGGAITSEAASAAIASIIDDETVVFNEYPLQRAHCPFNRPGSYFGHSPAGGLGWGFGAALGYKLAAPDKFVIATLGDGAYIFANPIAGHAVAAAENLPILVIVFDNGRYNAVRRSTLGMYAQGASAADDGMFLARLDGTPDYAQIARAHGAHAESVYDLAELPNALRIAKEAVISGCQALVNIQIAE
jgi:acetolactate synthase-1/2/3 large subunit